MRQILGGEDFDLLLDGAKTRAFHLETHDDYRAEIETDSLRAFLADETTDPGGDWFAPWINRVGRMAGRGVAVHRVRIVTEPHTAYTRYLLALTRYNVAAGEDVRYLARHNSPPTDAHTEDFWLLDDQTVAYSLFDAEGLWIGGAATEDTVMVANAIAIRDRVWGEATPYHDYLGHVTT
ncbi:hypothetical protein H0264_06035 [Nocardia huaxiensis]|uniref:DUF6879 domain-containing protein n=1 Tax=Nocardia huaxiensis TaxID=2755382 RepID=A0A7D6ZRB8_9NOCA|nr:DUF6879 family protein [Nocardia huaxiensis]QLY31865.1 hypothetical protein H0264_06035 [Nocardia huaxiensis]